VTSPPIEVQVLHVFASLQRGGAEIRMLEIINACREDSVRHHVLLLSRVTGPLEAEYRAAGVTVSRLPVKSPRFGWKFRNLLQQHRIDVVHSHVALFSGYVLFLARLAGVPGRIAHLRSDAPGPRPGLTGKLFARFLHALMGWSATAIVAVSPGALSAVWSQYWTRDPRCRVLLSGLNLRRMDEAISKSNQARAELGVGATENLIVHVGRDVPVKNRGRAIEVVAELSALTGRRPWLVFVGRDNDLDRHRFLRHAASLGIANRVISVGERGDAAAFVAAADLLLLTSTIEGLPGVVVEAAAVGTPVLASRLPGTAFIADRLSGVHLQDLKSSNSEWAATARNLLSRRPSARARHAAASAMRGSAFDIELTSRQHTELWIRSAIRST
jgi:glycosyltransferase involved in cell wall biosynthesis